LSVSEANLNSRLYRTLEPNFLRPAVERLVNDLRTIELRRVRHLRAGNIAQARVDQDAINTRIYEFGVSLSENGAYPPPDLMRSIRTSVANYVTMNSSPFEYAGGSRTAQRLPAFDYTGRERWGDNSLASRAGRDEYERFE